MRIDILTVLSVFDLLAVLEDARSDEIPIGRYNGFITLVADHTARVRPARRQ